MKHPRLFGCAFLLACASLCLPAPVPAAEDRPNVLLLFADDQRADTIAAWGNPHIRTPNLDRLAARGFSFRQNYCFGSNSGAVCVPSRAMLMTGRTWLHVDAQIKGVPMMPEAFGKHGYVTFGTGKWHNGKPSWLRAFQRGKNVFFGGMNDHTRVHVHDLIDGKLTDERIGEKFSSELFADAVTEFLSSYTGDQPFFAYCAFTAPHDPRNPPEEYREIYYKDRPPLPENFLPQHPFDNGMVYLRDEVLAGWPRTRPVISDQLAEYYGLITHLDEQVGRILAALEKSPHAKNTIIVYAADHGLAMGSHGLLGKQSVYEHSMRCPLIVAGPGIPAGKSTRAFTYLLDLFPTLCAVTGVPVPEGVEGKDLRPIWAREKEKVRDSVFLPFQDKMRAVRDERYKLIVYPQINHRQLFDLEKDPHEMKDLAGDPAHADTVKRLLALMREWQEKVGDKQALRSPKPKPKEIDLTGRERTPDRWQPEWIRKKYFGEKE